MDAKMLIYFWWYLLTISILPYVCLCQAAQKKQDLGTLSSRSGNCMSLLWITEGVIN